MKSWTPTTLGAEIELLYGKSLPEAARKSGQVPVFGSNGVVGFHVQSLLDGPGIIIGRKGSVGAVNYTATSFWPIDTTYYVHNPKGHNWLFLFYILQTLGLSKMNSHSAVPGLNRESVYSLNLSIPEQGEQEKVAAVLWKVQRAIEVEDKLIATIHELKQSAMGKLFTCGLRGEAQKETDIGLLPQSWHIKRLEDCCDVVSSSLPYTDFYANPEATNDNAVLAMGIKVSDMNLPGNESQIVRANIQKKLEARFAEKKLVPPNAIVFPKRGAAIATNKKRMTTAWTVLDPNLIGVRAGDGVDSNFLFYWFQRFDLRTITEPGPTPQLNKKNLTPLLLPIPYDPNEQREIANILGAIDRKIAVHERKRGALQELFKTLLHQLMSGQIRVANLDIDTKEVTA